MLDHAIDSDDAQVALNAAHDKSGAPNTIDPGASDSVRDTSGVLGSTTSSSVSAMANDCVRTVLPTESTSEKKPAPSNSADVDEGGDSGTRSDGYGGDALHPSSVARVDRGQFSGGATPQSRTPGRDALTTPGSAEPSVDHQRYPGDDVKLHEAILELSASEDVYLEDVYALQILLLSPMKKRASMKGVIVDPEVRVPTDARMPL